MNRKVSTEFRYMEADMHNLMPSVGEVNGLRSNYSFAMISGEPRRFGAYDMEIEGRAPLECPRGYREDVQVHGCGLPWTWDNLKKE